MERKFDNEETAKRPILDYAKPENLKFAVIARFPDEAEARMAACKLEGEDIWVAVEGHISACSNKRSARLKVLSEDATRAISILRATPARIRLIIAPDDENRP